MAEHEFTFPLQDDDERSSQSTGSPKEAGLSRDRRDHAWLSAIQRGDTGAFESLFREYHPRLCNFAYRFAGSREIAEELVQETFMYVWQRRDTLDIRGSVSTYLFSSIRNAAVSFLRHEKVVALHHAETTRLFTPGGGNAQQEMEANETASAVRASVARLPEGARMVFTLHREQGLTYREIGEVLGISPKTVDNQMGRALKALRKYLGPHRP